ncbi:MAG: hypothetical protein AAF903_16030, partial [Pseudomonadota bacterium]
MAKRDETNALERIFSTGDATFLRSFRPPRPSPAQQSLWPNSSNFNAAMVVWLVAIVIAFAGLDGPIARWARVAATPDTTLHSLFDDLTVLGESLWVLLITFAIFMTLATIRWREIKPRERFRLAQFHGAAFFTFATVAIIGTTIGFVKRAVGRARPSQLETLGPYNSGFPIWDATFASFPSGHSTTF